MFDVDGCGDRCQVAWVGANDVVAASQGALDDAGVYAVGCARASGEGPGGPGPGFIEGLDVASGQEPGEVGARRKRE
jgi:hypothetical protein